MKVNHEEVRNVSGIMFQIVNEYEEKMSLTGWSI